MYNIFFSSSRVKRTVGRHCHSSNKRSALSCSPKKCILQTLVDVADSRCGIGDVRGVRGVCEWSRVSGVGDRGCVRGVGDRGCVCGVSNRGSRVDNGCGMRRVRDSGCSGDCGYGRQEAGGRCRGDAGDEKGEKNGALAHDDVAEEVAGANLILLRGLSEDCYSNVILKSAPRQFL